MTCEYFSIKDGKLFCRTYGAIDSSPEKIEECHSNYLACFNIARRMQAKEAEKQATADSERKESVVLERMARTDITTSKRDFF